MVDPEPVPLTDDDALQNLVAQCLDRWEDEGPDALADLCARHPERAPALRQRVDALRALGLLDDASGNGIGEALPERIGAYRVLRVLGRGGMGVVFEAEQDAPQRRVAVKVLRSGLGSPELRSRFAHEALVLARLQHPGVAQIHEAGSATVGGEVLPFFAMELVQGRQVTEYARAHDLDVRARIELLARICDAVQHAHQKGVIHRDLKPSNILIDASGQPKLLDFGVARVVEDHWRATLHTRQGQLVGTPAYMSPEQAAATPDQIDTRSDVYSLGVLAHELLGGDLPYRVEGLRITEALRVVLETEPARLGAIDPALGGDIETIVLTALAKEKERRYPSAEAFASDLRRYLRDEPIAARAPTGWYTLRKFARRNRALVTSALVVVAALALGLAGTLVGLFHAQRAQADAERRWRQADAAVEFQRRMLAADHVYGAGPDARVLDVITGAARALDGAYADQPEVEGQLRLTIGEAYDSLGLNQQAQEEHQRALDLLRPALGESAPEVLAAAAGLVRALTGSGQLDRARTELARARAATPAASTGVAAAGAQIALRSAEARLLGAEGKVDDALRLKRALFDELHTQGSEKAEDEGLELANMLRQAGRGNEAAALLSGLADEAAAHFGPRHARTLTAQIALATALQSSGQIPESRALTDRLLPLVRSVFGDEQPQTLATLAAAAFNANHSGDYRAAEDAFRDLLRVAEKRYGPTSTYTSIAKNNLAQALIAQEKWDDADAILRPLHALLTQVRGPEHFETMHVLHSLAHMLQEAKRLDEARPLLERVLEVRRRTQGVEHHSTLQVMRSLGLLYSVTGRLTEADALLREAVDTAQRVLEPSNFLTGDLLGALGRNLLAMERHAEAESALLAAHAWLVRTRGAAAGQDEVALLVRLYERWGKPEQAAAWRERAR